MKKTTVIEMLELLGEEFNTEGFIEALLFRERVEKGLKDVEDGKVMNYATVKQNLHK
jgi:hypothetical protein